MGHEPDASVAEAAGVATAEVKAYRRELGIAPFKRVPGVPDAPPPREQGGAVVRRRRAAGGQVDEVVVRGREAVMAASQQGNPLERFVSELGTVGDGVIADKAGVPRWRVVEYRKKLGIPAYDGFRFQRRPDASTPAVEPRRPEPELAAPSRKLTAIGSRRAGRPSPLDAHVAMLGTMPDSAVAQRVGVSVAAVTQYRRRRGISPSGRSGGTQTPAPAPAPVAPVLPVTPVVSIAPPVIAAKAPIAPVVAPHADNETLFAYKVSVRSRDDERRFFTLAPNIGTGLRQAEEALADRDDGPWVVTGVRLAGDAFPKG